MYKDMDKHGWVLVHKMSGEILLPLYISEVSCGFPSPAEDYAEKLDLVKELIPNPDATFLLRAKGDSMEGDNIHDGDLLIVDFSIRSRKGKVVISSLNKDEFTVKRLVEDNGNFYLQASNENYPAIPIQAGDELQIYGVVTHSISRIK